MILTVFNKKFGELRLIPLDHKSTKDYKLFKEILCDPDIMKTSTLFRGDIARDEKEIHKYFVWMTKSNSLYDIGLYKIIDKNNIFMGVAGMGVVETTKDKKVKVLELIYFLKAPYRSSKVGFNVSQALLKYVFDNYPALEQILGISYYNNRPSHIIMLKLGFKYITRKFKRGAVINYSILTKELYQNHQIKPTEYYKKSLEEIINTEYPILEIVDDSII